MAVFDLYSKRQRRTRGEVSDVYQYDELPDGLRTQISYIVAEVLGTHVEAKIRELPAEAYGTIERVLKKEYGQQTLNLDPRGSRLQSAYEALHHFLLNEFETEKCLDAIELCFLVADGQARKYSYLQRRDASEHVDDAINELNARFKEAGCGYEFIEGKILRIDSQFIHSETVKPALIFLNAPDFEGAREEFLGAYDHYRHENHKEALVDALKAFESTLKTILTLNDKEYATGDTANKLVLACSKAGLIPAYSEAHLTSLTNVLINGIPTIRNREGGHGQGEAVRTVEPEIVAYGLHLTASAITMLAGLQAKRN